MNAKNFRIVLIEAKDIPFKAVVSNSLLITSYIFFDNFPLAKEFTSEIKLYYILH